MNLRIRSHLSLQQSRNKRNSQTPQRAEAKNLKFHIQKQSQSRITEQQPSLDTFKRGEKPNRNNQNLWNRNGSVRNKLTYRWKRVEEATYCSDPCLRQNPITDQFLIWQETNRIIITMKEEERGRQKAPWVASYLRSQKVKSYCNRGQSSQYIFIIEIVWIHEWHTKELLKHLTGNLMGNFPIETSPETSKQVAVRAIQLFCKTMGFALPWKLENAFFFPTKHFGGKRQDLEVPGFFKIVFYIFLNFCFDPFLL